MILCRKCGHQNADDASFCSNCNSFLEWSGDTVRPAQAPDAPPPTPAAGSRPSNAPAATRPGASAPPPPPATAAQAGGPAARPPAATPAAPPARRPAAAPAPQPASRQPSAEAGTAARPRTTQPTRTEEQPIKAGDRICPTCGAGNDPARRFCRRCGSGLELAQVAVAAKRPPWYRRLSRHSDAVLQAGARPTSMVDPGTSISSILGKVLPFFIVVAIMGAVGSYFVMPDIHRQVDTTIAQLKRQFLPDLVPVTPTASGSAEALLDRNLTTDWEGTGNKPSFTLRFDPTVDLGNIIVSNGATTDDFAVKRRALALDLIVNGKSHTPLTLTDGPAAQSQRIDLRDVSTLKVVVTQSTGPDDAPVAIRDLEFSAIR